VTFPLISFYSPFMVQVLGNTAILPSPHETHDVMDFSTSGVTAPHIYPK
jgi:hypothetical protein